MLISQRQLSMAGLAFLLSRYEGQIVRDMTGLKGLFDVRLEWTPDFNRARAPGNGGVPAPIDSAPGPTIFTAVQEQVGLKLESRKGLLDVVVIDHAEPTPTEN